MPIPIDPEVDINIFIKLRQGLEMHHAGQLEKAKLIYEEILIIDPSNFDALHLLGVIATQDNLLVKALRLFNEAIKINKLNPAVYNNRGIVLKRLEFWEEALASFDLAIEKNPDYLEAFINRGNVLLDLNRNLLALYNFEQAINLSPEYPEIYFKCGTILHGLNRLEKSLINYNKAIEIKPNYAEAYSNRGLVLEELNCLDEALVSFDLAIEIKPDFAEAYFNKANILKKLNRLEDALIGYNNAIKIKVLFAEAYNNSGLVLHDLKRYGEAIEHFSLAIKIKQEYSEAFFNRGNALRELGFNEKALQDYIRATDIRPTFSEAYSNKGIVLQELKRNAEALASYDQAISIKPDNVQAYLNRGNFFQELKFHDKALENYNIALDLKSDYADAYWNKSLALLEAGQFDQGWRLYEWRWKKDTFTSLNRNFPQPLWLGAQDIAGKTILLHSEQGLGDTIQFCRYATLVEKLGARVVLEVPKALLGLLGGLEGVHELVEKGEAIPAFDYQCPLMSLPLAFKTTLDSIPNKIPYINSNINKQNKWKDYIGELGFKVAICWQGSTKGKVDIGRSFPARLFEGLAQINGVRLFSLQKNEGVEQLKNLPVAMKVETFPDDFDSGENGFLDSAAVMKCVDLVITSDTALTHLAGALGVKTWLPLKYVPDWRWMLERSDSPWYPNHRLFRQTTRDDWTSVFDEIEAELKTLVSTQSTKQQ